MKCISPTIINPTPVARLHGATTMQVPCGKCIPCLARRSSEWSLRLLHELPYWDAASFVTWTYADDFLPVALSVVKDHLQLCIKRLRKLYPPKGLRYYACGEYGTISARPHYHAIIFGLSVKDHCVLHQSDNKLLVQGGPLYDTWSYGRIGIGTVTSDSCKYVAKYIDKAFFGDKAAEIYDATGRERPFQLCSQGLGYRFARDNIDQLRDMQYTTYKGIPTTIPRYYSKRFDIVFDKEVIDYDVHAYLGSPTLGTYMSVFSDIPDDCDVADLDRVVMATNNKELIDQIRKVRADACITSVATMQAKAHLRDDLDVL
nr:MAG: replication initiator protein [Microviridae sp.]